MRKLNYTVIFISIILLIFGLIIDVNLFKNKKFSVFNVKLNNKINGIDEVFYVYNPKLKSHISFFVENTEKGVKVLSDDRDYICTYNKEKTTYTVNEGHDRFSRSAKSGDCYGDCMKISESNWHDDDNGGIMNSYNDITWQGVGYPLAAINCGACCEGWWSCPSLSKAKTKEDIEEMKKAEIGYEKEIFLDKEFINKIAENIIIPTDNE